MIWFADGDSLTVECGGVRKALRVVDRAEYAFRLRKRGIDAEGGAVGLAARLSRWDRDGYCGDLVKKVCDWVMTVGKGC